MYFLIAKYVTLSEKNIIFERPSNKLSVILYKVKFSIFQIPPSIEDETVYAPIVNALTDVGFTPGLPEKTVELQQY